MRRALTKVLIGLLVLGGAYLVLFFGDVLTRPSVTEAERTRAYSYVRAEALKEPPIPFYHDGCTAWPDFLLWHDFSAACLHHDIVYWVGGSDAQKKQADRKLKDEIAATGPLGPMFANIMYVAVAYGGDNYISHLLGSNWGYGWNK